MARLGWSSARLTALSLKRTSWRKSRDSIQPSFDHLVDLRGTTRLDVSTEGVHLVSMHSAFNEKSRRAIVAEKDEMFGVARMYQSLRELFKKPDQVRVFYTMEEARHWLGLDEATNSN